ncbi:MAG TPA: DUF3899 domain-containing protein [Bacillales bacterium]|nr:DUF3899 domain-containing protein [Bacillales bacterium]
MQFRQIWIYSAIVLFSLILAAMFATVNSSEWSLLSVINAAFLASLLLLIVGASLFVISGGFFNAIVYSFRRFFRKGTKMGKLLEGDDEDDIPKPVSFSITYPLLIVGGILFIVTMILSYIV